MAQQFASDNNAGICPEALEVLLRANAEGHVAGYGDDAWTAKACDRLRDLFETDCEVFFVFNGTAANALTLAQLARPYHAIIAHRLSHIEEDEAGAPGYLSGGAKIVALDLPLAKLTPAAVRATASAGRSEDCRGLSEQSSFVPELAGLIEKRPHSRRHVAEARTSADCDTIIGR